jgi:hypothetical protein
VKFVGRDYGLITQGDAEYLFATSEASELTAGASVSFRPRTTSDGLQRAEDVQVEHPVSPTSASQPQAGIQPRSSFIRNLLAEEAQPEVFYMGDSDSD